MGGGGGGLGLVTLGSFSSFLVCYAHGFSCSMTYQ